MAKDFQNQAGFDSASMLRRPAVRASDVAVVRQNYDIAPDFKAKGKSDTQLYEFSRDAIIKWWRKRMKDAAAQAAAPAGVDGGPGGYGSGGGVGGSGGGGSGGFMLPNTAMGRGAGYSTLPSIPDTLPGKTVGQTQQLAAQLHANQAAQMANMDRQAAPPASTGVGTTQLQTALKAAGLNVGISSVPSSARVSAEALAKWIATQRKPSAQQAKQLQANQIAKMAPKPTPRPPVTVKKTTASRSGQALRMY